MNYDVYTVNITLATSGANWGGNGPRPCWATAWNEFLCRQKQSIINLHESWTKCGAGAV